MTPFAIPAASADRQHVRGVRYVDELICRVRSTIGETLYATYDANFSITAILDTSGTTQERYLYDPYGLRYTLGANWSSRAATTYGWNVAAQGITLDPETGLILNRRRYVDTLLGRFLTRDTFTFTDDSNQYEYLESNPHNHMDPLGLQVQKLGPPQIEGPCDQEEITRAEAECAPLGGLKLARCRVSTQLVGGHLVQTRLLSAFCFNTGDCSATLYARLQAEVHPWCDLPRSCKNITCPCLTSWDNVIACSTIASRIFIGESCALKRETIMNQCFNGGDQPHKDELKKVRDALDTCVQKWTVCKCG